MTRPRVIRQGDSLTRIAHQVGLSAEEIWQHAANQGLRERRVHMDVLAPGDIVQIPEREPVRYPVSPGEANRYQAVVPRVEVALILEDGEGEPYADEGVRVYGAAAPIDARTDAEGRVVLNVPVYVRELRVVLTESGRTFRLLVGHLDPVECASGVAQRLEHLGYRAGAGVDLDRLRGALEEFQHDRGLAVTGEANEETRQALVREHQS